MIIDHVTLIYFPEWVLGRIIGRLATPIFFYLLAIGYKRSNNRWAYLQRLIVWGCIAEAVLIIVGLKFPYLNILFTLAYCLLTLMVMNHWSKFKLLIGIASCILVSVSPIRLDYSWYAVASTILFSVYDPKSSHWWFLWTLINCLGAGLSSPIKIFALPAPLIISSTGIMKLSLPRLEWMWYFLYPLQWWVIIYFPLISNINVWKILLSK